MIETKRLIMRPFQEGDAEDVYEYLAEPAVNCFACMKLSSLEEAKAAVKERSADAEYYFAIVLKENGKVIGEIFAHTESYSPEEESVRDTFSPCWMLNKEYYGKGYAYEAAHAILDYLFREKGARRIYAYTEDYNVSCQKLCEKLGMRREGLFQEFVSFVNDAEGNPIYENTYQYAILKKEWESKWEEQYLKSLLECAKELFELEGYDCSPVNEHEGGRNLVCVCSKDGEKKYVLRISGLGDRCEEEYLAETEFVRYLVENGAPVADVIPSVQGKLVECVEWEGTENYISLFAYAKGMLICDNGYRYREGAPLEEYFYNTGKVLGAIHRLSKSYTPTHKRPEYFDKYNMEYINQLIPDTYGELKEAIAKRLEAFKELPMDGEAYGLVHFDFSDGNYHIDMSTGDITAFDFDNCLNCWYMFDLANLWTHGEGWFRFEQDPAKRMEYMKGYFDKVLEGYRSETDVAEELLEQLPLFIDMVLIENIVDECECALREGEEVDYEDIEDAAECLIEDIPYAGIGEE